MENLHKIISHFNIEGTTERIEPLGAGLINDSFIIKTKEADCPDYVLQRINHNVFKDVELLEKNIQSVTDHIRKRLINENADDIDRKVLRFIPTIQNRYVYNDGSNFWRIMIFIPRAVTLEEVNPESSYYAGLTFGEFQGMLSDFTEPLGEPIPDFHNMEFRLKQFREAVRDNKAGRAAETKELIDLIEENAGEMCFAERLFREGLLPKRICHCDTKVNNMMYDESGLPLCVIDLDTVMPSFVFSDYGDFLRSAANKAAEDEKDLTKIEFDMDIFRSFTKGYLEASTSFLTSVEKDNLYKAVALFPYMQATRFLTDYLNGDTYYKIKYEEHNLDRTKNQLELFRQINCLENEIAAYINNCINA